MVLANEKIYIAVIILVMIIVFLFGLNYYIKKVVRDELIRIKKRRQSKRRLGNVRDDERRTDDESRGMMIRRRMEQVGDMDSYIDPVQERDQDFADDYN